LGLISVGGDVFLCVVTHASRVATVRPGETVERILSVQFFCLNSSGYDDVVSVDPYDLESDAVTTYGQNLSRRDNPIEHPCQELQKLLSNGSFYYSTDFDVTNRLQDRFVSHSPPYRLLGSIITRNVDPQTPRLLISTILTSRSSGTHT
jgi:hypothetical protein